MNKIMWTILLLFLWMSCHTTSARKVESKQNNMGMEKKNSGNLLVPSPKPVTAVGDMGITVTTGCLNLEKQPGMCAKEPMAADGIVRLSKIEIYAQYLDEYMQYVTEVGEVSLRTEPGVLTMYAVGEKENPCKVTILETYASKEAYEKHIASEHFRKYKQGTLHMVKSLELSDQKPLNPANRIYNFIQ